MNIHGIGTDLVDINRIITSLSKIGFLNTVFTEGEIAYCRQQTHPEQSYAARFAAKEAYMKGIGTGWSAKADFKEIEIVSKSMNPPCIILHGETKKHFENLGLKEIFVSLSHTPTNALAFVILAR